LPNSKPFITQCRSSARSAIAASILQAAGVAVIDMSGGIDEWQDAGLPVSTAEELIPCDA
ncbi:MAG: rhodanese-like domain-containing protein, partial [Lacipirellulaceae bacterium]